MSPRAPKLCGHPDCDREVVARTYCDEHEAAYLARRARGKRRSPSSLAAANDRRERARRTAAVRAWVRAHGWVCPGWQRPPHPSRDLTAAHSIAVARDGVDSPLSVLCRSCNSSQNEQPSLRPLVR